MRYLEREGYATLETGDGDDARALVERESPDLVVLDVMLPGTDGLELCRWIRSRSELPVIMLTARGEEADRIVGLELGADDYVTKPFSPRELAARVRTVLRRTRASGAAPAAPRLRRGRARRGDPGGATGRRRGAPHGQGVRPALVPREPSAPGLRARSADEPGVGVRGGARHGHRHRPRPPAAREDRGRTLPTRSTSRPCGASATGSCRDAGRDARPGDRRRAADARRRARRRAAAPSAAEPAAPARGPRRALGLPAARVGAALRLGRVQDGRRRQDPRRLGRVGDGRGRRGARARALDRRLRRPRPRRLCAARARRSRASGRRSRDRRRSPSSPPRSTRWRPASSSSSTRAASSSPGRATTCARRSPTCRRCSRRSRTASSSPTTTLPVLREQVEHLSTLVDDLFELARIDAGALTLELRDAELEPVVEACLRGVEADARRRGVDLDASVPKDVRARFAPEKVERVLFNLLTNALRHTPSDGSVAVRVEQLGRRGAGQRRGHRRRSRRGGAPADVRPLLARRPGALRPGRGPRARDRARHRRGARWTDLGGVAARAAGHACRSRCPGAA